MPIQANYGNYFTGLSGYTTTDVNGTVASYILRSDGTLQETNTETLKEEGTPKDIIKEISKIDTTKFYSKTKFPLKFKTSLVKEQAMFQVFSIEMLKKVNPSINKEQLNARNSAAYCPQLPISPKEQKICSIISSLSGKFKVSVSVLQYKGKKIKWEDMIIETKEGIIIGCASVIGKTTQESTSFYKNLTPLLYETDFFTKDIEGSLYSIGLEKERIFITYLEVSIEKI